MILKELFAITEASDRFRMRTYPISMLAFVRRYILDNPGTGTESELRGVPQFRIKDSAHRAILELKSKWDKKHARKVSESEDSPFVKSVYDDLVHFVKHNRKDIEQWCEENNYSYYDPDETLDKVKASLADLESKGYSKQDAYSMMRNLEDLDPRIPEDRALAKMAAIRAKYK